jgi:predicted nucleic acid-binding protein
MIAVDTSILLDVILRTSQFAEPSRAALKKARSEGGIFVCEIVYAELAAHFGGDVKATDRFLDEAGIDLVPSDRAVLARAGEIWRAYRKSGGTRERMVPDFLIGAHAAVRAGALLTRDKGFYRAHFKKLRIVDPQTTRGKT